MTRLEKLIEELCPNGVTFRTLNEIGTIFKGMSGVTNKWAENGNCRFVDYKNVYNNIKIDVLDLPFATVKKIENQIVLNQGDILFTSASETPDECAISSVIEKDIVDGILLDDHLFGIRLNKTVGNPIFFNYYFRSDSFRKTVNKTVRGVTRFYISMPEFAKIKIPLPPLEVQAEIVRILDDYSTSVTALQQELEKELTARKKQYEYYRDMLLNYDVLGAGASEFEWKTIKDICKTVCSGGTPSSKNQNYYGGNIPWLRTQEVDFKEIKTTELTITEDGLKNSSAKWIPQNCVIVAMYGATVGKVAYTTIPLTTNQACCNLQINESIALFKYVYYWLANCYEYIKSLGQGSQTNINANIVKDLKIPVPPLPEQERIVHILDRFDKLCNDISEGLPAEIEARQKQYEYYRDKLLTFKELTV